MFFTHQAFPIFIPLAVPWDPNFDPCCKRAILTGALKIHIKIVYVFYPSGDFHFHSFGCPLGFQLGSLLQKWDPDKCAQNSHKHRLCFFYPSDTSHFHSFGCPWGPQLGSLRQKCDPDKCTQNSHKSRVWFCSPQTCSVFAHCAVPLRATLDLRDKSIALASASKTHIKVAYRFLAIRHFPCPPLCLFLGVPTWVLVKTKSIAWASHVNPSGRIYGGKKSFQPLIFIPQLLPSNEFLNWKD